MSGGRRGRSRLVALLACAALVAGCDWVTRRRLQGTWESEPLPKRRLELRSDGTFSRRLSGRTLGFLSDALGPEQGSWRLEDDSLVLVRHEGESERSEKLKIKGISPREVTLGGEVWRRVVDPAGGLR